MTANAFRRFLATSTVKVTRIVQTTVVQTVSPSPASTNVSNAATQSVGGTATGLSTSSQVAIALPVSCPDQDGQTITNVLGGRYEFMLKCRTSIAQNNTLAIMNATDVNDCAAQCSHANELAQSAVCQSAMLTNATTNNCILSGNTVNYANTTGSDVAVLTNVYTVTDSCPGNFSNGPANASIDTSAIVASVTQSNVPVSSWTVVFDSSSAGETQAFVTQLSTDSNGVIHWAWQSVFASSNVWEKVFSTSWTCTNQVPQTLVIPQTVIVPGGGSSFNVVTTIIRGGFITVISNGQTSIWSAGGMPNTASASVTGGSGVFSTAGAASMGLSAGGSGALSLPTATGAAGSNQTASPGSLSTLGGSAAVTVSGGLFTTAAASGAGVITPTPTASETIIVNGTASNVTVEGSGATFVSSNGEGVVTPTVSPTVPATLGAGASNATLNGGFSTAITLSGEGAITPTPSGVLSSVTGLPSNATTVPSGGLNTTIAGASSTAFSTGGEGTITPNSSPAVSGASAAPSNATTALVSVGSFTPSLSGNVSTAAVETGSSGALITTLSGALSTANSTGGEGITPLPSTNVANMTGPAESVVTIFSSGMTANSTGDSGQITPTPTTGSFVGVVGGSSITFNSTGVTGEIPSSVTSPLTSSGGLPQTIGNTSAALSTGTSGESSPLSLPTNANGTAGTPSSLASTGVETTAIANLTGQSGMVVSTTSTPPANGSAATTPVFLTSVATLISTIITPVNSSVPGGFSTATSPGESGLFPNSSVTAPASLTPVPSANLSTTSPFDFSNSEGDRTGGYRSRTSGTPNITFPGTAPSDSAALPSGTAPILNSSFAIPTPSENSPGPNSSVSLETGVTGTGPYPTSLLLNATSTPSEMVPTLPASVTIPPESLNMTQQLPTPNATETSSVPESITSVLVSVTVPPVSLNSTLPSTYPNSTGDFSNTNGPRIGTFSRTRSSHPSESMPVPSENSTMPFGSGTTSVPAIVTTPAVTSVASSVAPPSSENSTVSFGSGTESVPASVTSAPATGLPSVSVSSSANYTLPAVSRPSGVSSLSETPVPSSNYSTPAGTGESTAPPLSASSGFPTPSENSSVPIGPYPTSSASSIDTACVPLSTVSLETVTTLIPVETVLSHTLVATSCASSYPLEMLTPTGVPPPPPFVYSVPLSTRSAQSPAASATAALPDLRKVNATATDAQISRACANKGNLVYNSGFDAADNAGAPLDWFSNQNGRDSRFDAYNSTRQHAGSSTHSARVILTASDTSITISQPLTLCPNTRYQFSSWDRQADLLSECQTAYGIGGYTLFAVFPQEFWRQHNATFTTGATPQDCSLDLSISVVCRGNGGSLVGDGSSGMITELDSLRITAQ